MANPIPFLHVASTSCGAEITGMGSPTQYIPAVMFYVTCPLLG